MSCRDVGDRSDIVLSCLTGPESHRDAILGPAGVASGNRAQTYIHLGTSGSALIEEIAAGLGPRVVLDAPITGGVPKARDGTLSPAEADELDGFLPVDALIGVLRLKAERSLRHVP